jgi:uncharacterized membrane protein
MLDFSVRPSMRAVAAAFFLWAAYVHLAVPEKLVSITPDWVPNPRLVVQVTGVLEAAGAVALAIPRLRWWAGCALALYTLMVWPANIKHAMQGIVLPPVPDSWWYHGPRLALQPVIMWWLLFCAEVIDWPFRKAPHATTPPAAERR